MEGDNRRQLEEKKKTRLSLLEEKLTEALTLLLQLRSKVHRLSHTHSLPSSGSSIITLGFGASSGQTRVSAFKLDQNMHENNVEVQILLAFKCVATHLKVTNLCFLSERVPQGPGEDCDGHSRCVQQEWRWYLSSASSTLYKPLDFCVALML